jgi:Right handed beta helix region
MSIRILGQAGGGLALAVVLGVAACTNHFVELFDDVATADAGRDAAYLFDAGAPCMTQAGSALPLPLPRITSVQYHVATSGSDGARGTLQDPWRTVQKAVETLAIGETAVIHAGTYNTPVSWSSSGTSESPISLIGAGDGETVLTGDVEIKGQYVRVAGLVFDGSLRTGFSPLIAVRGGRDVEISNNELRAAKGAGIEAFEYGTKPDRLRIIGNAFHDSASGVALHSGTSAAVGSNTFIDMSETAVLLDPDPQQALVVSSSLARCRVGVAVGVSASATVAGARIVGNIFMNQREGAVNALAGGLANEARRNLFFINGGGAINGTITQSENQTQVDPLYAAARDLHVGATSPAVGTGDLAFTPAFDRDGRCRPVNAPDIGAYEQ